MEIYEVKWEGAKNGEGFWVEVENEARDCRRQILLLLNGQTIEEVVDSGQIYIGGGRLKADSSGVYMEKSFPLIHEEVQQYMRSRGDKRYVETGFGRF